MRVLVAVLAWFGVLLQLVLSIRLALAGPGSVLDGLVAYLGYFTVLTNLFVACVSTWPVRRILIGCATASIVLVGLSYHLLLRNVWSPQGWQWVADIVLHYAVPLVTLSWWIASRRSGPVPAWAPWAWCLYPTAYLLYALVRGELIGRYPYPFIDVAALGYGQVWINGFALLAAFIVIAYAIWAIARFPGRASARR